MIEFKRTAEYEKLRQIMLDIRLARHAISERNTTEALGALALVDMALVEYILARDVPTEDKPL